MSKGVRFRDTLFIFVTILVYLKNENFRQYYRQSRNSKFK